MKIRTQASLLRRALWRFDDLCARRQWLPLVGVLALLVFMAWLESK